MRIGRLTPWIAAALGVALLAPLTLAGNGNGGGGGGKPGGGGGGDPGNTTPLDILYQVPEGSGYGTLYAMQDDGSGSVALAPTRGSRASWSPDGTQVAFYGYENGFGVYVADVDGGTPQKLISIANLTAGFLDWCPVPGSDGTHKLAFTSRDDSGTSAADLYVARFDGSGVAGVERLTSTTGDERWPTWSPGGEQIAVEYHSQIRVLDLADRDGSGAPSTHVVYESTRFDPGPVAWAKTSTALAFSAYDADHATSGASSLTDLFVVQLSHASGAWSGSAAQNLTSSPDDEETDPSWCPDDSRLVLFDAYWRRGAGNGSAKTSLQVLNLASGSRQTLGSTGVAPVWRRAAP